MGTPSSGFGARWVLTPDTRRFQRRAQVHKRMRACVHLFRLGARIFFHFSPCARDTLFFASDVRFLIDVGTINMFRTLCRRAKGLMRKISTMLFGARRVIGKRNSFSAGDLTLMARAVTTRRQSCRVLVGAKCSVGFGKWKIEETLAGDTFAHP
jgi:hypothetical protein